LLPDAIFYQRSVAWRDWMVAVSGAAAPFAYLILFYWLSLEDMTTASDSIQLLLPEMPVAVPVFELAVTIFCGVLAVLVLLALGRGLAQKAGAKAKITYIRIIFVWMLLLCIAGTIFYPAYGYQLMPLTAIPLAAIASYWFSLPRAKKMKWFCYLLLIGAIVFLQIA
jgi:hypothetical protein